MDEIAERLARIEAKLDVLIAALAEAEEIVYGLDGEPIPPERDPNEPL